MPGKDEPPAGYLHQVPTFSLAVVSNSFVFSHRFFLGKMIQFDEHMFANGLVETST